MFSPSLALLLLGRATNNPSVSCRPHVDDKYSINYYWSATTNNRCFVCICTRFPSGIAVSLKSRGLRKLRREGNTACVRSSYQLLVRSHRTKTKNMKKKKLLKATWAKKNVANRQQSNRTKVKPTSPKRVYSYNRSSPTITCNFRNAKCRPHVHSISLSD